jgi:hypothetical protein
MISPKAACRAGNLELRELSTNKICKPIANRQCSGNKSQQEIEDNSELGGVPEEIRAPDPQIRRLLQAPVSTGFFLKNGVSVVG